MSGATTEVSTGALRVLLIDDVDEVRTVLRVVLEGDPRFSVVGEAADGLQGIEEARRLHPDLVLLDLVMPRLDGLRALPEIKAVAPDTRVVVLSSMEGVDLEDQARSLGAVGYLDKGLPAEEMVETLHALAGALEAVEQAVAEARSRLAPEVFSARSARSFVEETLQGWDCSHPLEVVKLLVSELVTNAVVHAGSEAEVVVQLTPTVVRVEVLDRSSEMPVVREAAPEDLSGRGLSLVQTYSGAWGIRPLPHGKAVWFEVAREA